MVLLLVVFASQAILSMRRKSVTTDEMVYVAAGYYHLRTGNFDFNLTNPPLMKLVAALPLLLVNPTLPDFDGSPAAWNEIEQWHYGRSFLYDNRIDADTLLFTARLPIVGLGIALGVLVFLWARELYGVRAGLLALFLYSFCPNVLAHTRLATHDLGLSAFMFAAAYCFWRHANRPTLGNLLCCGMAFGAALLTKTTAAFLVPMALIYVLALFLSGRRIGTWPGLPAVSRIRSAGLRQAASLAVSFVSIGVVALFLFNVIYLFQGSFHPISTYLPPERLYERLHIESAVAQAVVKTSLGLPLPVPEPFLQLVTFQAGRVSSGHMIYLAGEVSREGWWYHMLFTLLIKTPLVLLFLTAVALYQLVRARYLSSAESLIVIVCTVLLALFSYLKNVSIGLRYVLPVLPLFHVLASRLLRDGASLTRWRAWGLGGLLAWYMFGTLHIYPDYLAYFNELVGGPSNGYRYLADSNLDWGQDLKQLKAYLDRHEIPRIRLAYFGSGDARYYGIDYDYLPSVGLPPPPGGRWWYEAKTETLPPFEWTDEPVAISATLLAGLFYPGYYADLRRIEPTDQVGHSILIYDKGDGAARDYGVVPNLAATWAASVSPTSRCPLAVQCPSMGK